MTVKKKIHPYIFTVIFISVFLCMLNGCAASHSSGSSDQLRDINEYVVNKRTGKIHAPGCPSVQQMSENNKLLVSDSLTSLFKKDYTICRRCRAGLLKSGVSGIIDRIFNDNLYGEEIPIAASREDYLEAIDEMSEWYTSHVPTYASRIQEEPYSSYDGTYQGYKKYSLKNKGKEKNYIVLSSEGGTESASHLGKNDMILRGSEEAAKNYADCFSEIRFERKIAYYPCDLLNASTDYTTPGDDCVRYLFAVLNTMDSGFTQKYATLTNSSYSKTNSSMLATDYGDIAYGFTNLGFKIYDTTGQTIYAGRNSIAEGYVFKLDNGFKLQKGDIIAREGHVHIYLGNGLTVSAENFGWGRVYRSFPRIYDIEVYSRGGSTYITLSNSIGEKEYYRRVYRYIGAGRGDQL